MRVTPPINPSYAHVAARLLRPATPHRRKVASVVEKFASPGPAWRALAARGLLPPSFATPRRRYFRLSEKVVCARCRGKGRVGGYSGDPDEWEEDAWTCSECTSQGAVIGSEIDLDVPPSLDACIALASDPEGVSAAEAFAEEAAKGLARWGFPWDGRMIWRVSGPLHVCKWSFSEALRIFDFLQHGDKEVWKSAASTAFAERVHDVRTGVFYTRAQRHACGDQFWRAASARGDVVPATVSGVSDEALRPPAQIVGRPFAELPNPFAPLLSIWELGYVPVNVAPGPIVLLCPGG